LEPDEIRGLTLQCEASFTPLSLRLVVGLRGHHPVRKQPALGAGGKDLGCKLRCSDPEMGADKPGVPRQIRS